MLQREGLHDLRDLRAADLQMRVDGHVLAATSAAAPGDDGHGAGRHPAPAADPDAPRDATIASSLAAAPTIGPPAVMPPPKPAANWEPMSNATCDGDLIFSSFCISSTICDAMDLIAAVTDPSSDFRPAARPPSIWLPDSYAAFAPTVPRFLAAAAICFCSDATSCTPLVPPESSIFERRTGPRR